MHSSNKDDIFFQILKTAPVRYDPKTLCVRAYSGNEEEQIGKLSTAVPLLSNTWTHSEIDRCLAGVNIHTHRLDRQLKRFGLCDY